MKKRVTIIGSYLSPYVRKVRGAALEGHRLRDRFRKLVFAHYHVDAARWPRTNGYIQRVLEHDCFKRLTPYEYRMLRVPVAEHRAALVEMGAPLTAATYGTNEPRAGLMRI